MSEWTREEQKKHSAEWTRQYEKGQQDAEERIIKLLESLLEGDITNDSMHYQDLGIRIAIAAVKAEKVEIVQGHIKKEGLQKMSEINEEIIKRASEDPAFALGALTESLRIAEILGKEIELIKGEKS